MSTNCIAIPTPAELNTHQRNNTIAAYRIGRFDWSLNVVENVICEKSVKNKEKIVELLGSDTLVFQQTKTQDELVNNSYSLSSIVQAHPELSFNFPNKQVTVRDTGRCLPLKKWLGEKFQEDPARVSSIVEYVEQKRLLFMSCNPWFLLGSSIAAGGSNVESSCHHPNSSTEDYKSGPMSYAVDKHTLVFGLWNAIDNGMEGRQLIYLDLNAPGFISGRKYGELRESDSTFLRSELYKFFKAYKNSAWKRSKEEAFRKHYEIYHNGYSGYLDDSYFEGYRPQTDNTIEIQLKAPLCICCGEVFERSSLLCDDCGEDGRVRCYSCNTYIDEDESYSVDGDDYCSECYHDSFFNCDRCGRHFDKDDRIYDEGSGYSYCSSCADAYNINQCEECGEYHADLEKTPEGYYCERHMPDDYEKCEDCGEWSKRGETTVEGNYYCEDCVDSYDKCDECGRYTTSGTVTTTDGDDVCQECQEKHYPYECPVCNCYHSQQGACCEECATSNLFNCADSYQDNAIAA